METLTQKKCKPCEGIGKPLLPSKVQEQLKTLKEWQFDQTQQIITKDYVMKNFMAAIKLINSVAEISEAENHHPDIHLVGYRKLRIELTTHAVGGVTENDLIVAAKIDQLPVELKQP